VVFWQKSPQLGLSKSVDSFTGATLKNKSALFLSVLLLTGVSLYLGFGVKHVANLAMLIAGQLMDPQVYIDAVLKTMETP